MTSASSIAAWRQAGRQVRGAFLRAKGLAWAAELHRARQRAGNAATSPPTPPDRSGRRCACGITASPQAGHFAEGSGAGRRTPHRRRAAAWPPGGPPMSERLSPFRMAPGKPKRTSHETLVQPCPRLPCRSSPACSRLRPGVARAADRVRSLNYEQNLLSAARTLEQIHNQVRQLQNQAQSLLRMDQNLLPLGGGIAGPAAHARRQSQLRAGEGVALGLSATPSALRAAVSRHSAALTGDERCVPPRSRWEEESPASGAPPSCRARSSRRRWRRAPARHVHGALADAGRRPAGGPGRQRAPALNVKQALQLQACWPPSIAPKRSPAPATSPPRRRPGSASSPSSATARPIPRADEG